MSLERRGYWEFKIPDVVLRNYKDQDMSAERGGNEG